MTTQHTVEQCELVKTKVTKYQFSWTFNSIKNNNLNVGNCITSDGFSTGKTKSHHWTLHLFPLGYNQNFTKHMGVSIWSTTPRFINSNLGNITIEMCVIDKSGIECLNRKIQMSSYEVNTEKRVIRDFIERDYLFSMSSLLSNDSLKIQCQLSYDSENQDISSQIIDSPSLFTQIQSVGVNNFEKLLINSEFSDFKFIVGNTSFNVHRCILAAHSPVFSAMFHHDMLEKNEATVKIDDTDPNVMQALLRFLYSGVVDNLDGLVSGLFVAADKYQVDSLKRLCEEKLIEKLSIKTICETLQLLDKFGASKLHDAAFKFVMKNSKELVAMKEFDEAVSNLSSEFLASVIHNFLSSCECKRKK